MRRFDLLSLTACLAAGCAIPLDSEFDVDASLPADAAGSVVLAGCEPFRATTPGVLNGDLHSLVLSDGSALWLGQLATSSATIGFDVPAGADASCDGLATLGVATLAPSPLEPDGYLTPVDLVDTDAGPALYYQLLAPDASQPLGVRALGVGLAPRDPASGQFVPTSELLWSADWPVYGGSAVRDGDTVYVHGCLSTAAFTAACYVARAPAGQIASAAAYEYWTGSDWSANPEDAAPVVDDGGQNVSVRRDPGSPTRWLMTYVTPLGAAVSARSAIAPEGPWSAPATLFSCDLAAAGAGTFCMGGAQHAELAPPGGGLVVSVAADSFTSGARDADAFWPRVVAVAVPESLP